MSKSLIYFYGNQAMLSVGENATPIPKATAVAIHKLEARLVEAEEFAKFCANTPVGQMIKQLDRVREIPDFVENQSELMEEGDKPEWEYVVYLIRKALEE